MQFLVGSTVGRPCGYSLSPVILRRWNSGPRCFFSSTEHASFIKDVAVTHPPENLTCLLNILSKRGDTIISPGARQGLIPLVIPLSENQTAGTVTALLRWPTAPSGMEMPLVEVRKHGVCLLAKEVDQYIHRVLVEEDVNDSGQNNELFEASSEASQKLYKKGGFAESQMASLDVYLMKKVGLFPDVIEKKVASHFEKGDHVSALITGEFYTKNHFPGFGRPYVFNAEVLLKVGRRKEARDAARGALKSPWWTLGCRYEEVAAIAGWEDEQIEYIREKVSEQGRQEDIKKGKDPCQVALDQSAFLLDLASLEGNWKDFLEQIANCYKEAGLHDIARFVTYTE